jgi:hypothetical protein
VVRLPASASTEHAGEGATTFPRAAAAVCDLVAPPWGFGALRAVSTADADWTYLPNAGGCDVDWQMPAAAAADTGTWILPSVVLECCLCAS